jgi:hypothetical protein
VSASLCQTVAEAFLQRFHAYATAMHKQHLAHAILGVFDGVDVPSKRLIDLVRELYVID